MIEYRPIGEYAGYCWIDTRHADTAGILERYLQENDHAAAAGIPNQTRRQASMLGSGLLHWLAGTVLGTGQYVIARTASGKPCLEDQSRDRSIHVSISHSRDVVAAALDTRAAIGIDVEYCDYRRDFRRISERIFASTISSRIESPTVFYHAWCLYEAWGKANDLQHINPEKNTGLIHLLEDWLSIGKTTEIWRDHVAYFAPVENYAGCVFTAARTAWKSKPGDAIAL